MWRKSNGVFIEWSWIEKWVDSVFLCVYHIYEICNRSCILLINVEIVFIIGLLSFHWIIKSLFTCCNCRLYILWIIHTWISWYRIVIHAYIKWLSYSITTHIVRYCCSGSSHPMCRSATIISSFCIWKWPSRLIFKQLCICWMTCLLILQHIFNYEISIMTFFTKCID